MLAPPLPLQFVTTLESIFIYELSRETPFAKSKLAFRPGNQDKAIKYIYFNTPGHFLSIFKPEFGRQRWIMSTCSLWMLTIWWRRWTSKYLFVTSVLRAKCTCPRGQGHRKVCLVHHLSLMLHRAWHLKGSVHKRSPNFQQQPGKTEELSQKRMIIKLNEEAPGNSATL